MLVAFCGIYVEYMWNMWDIVGECLFLGSEKVPGLQAKSANHCGGIACGEFCCTVNQCENTHGRELHAERQFAGRGIFSCMGFCRTP